MIIAIIIFIIVFGFNDDATWIQVATPAVCILPFLVAVLEIECRGLTTAKAKKWILYYRTPLLKDLCIFSSTSKLMCLKCCIYSCFDCQVPVLIWLL